jgi:predicted enzyme related to lactoylglutathione lyase
MAIRVPGRISVSGFGKRLGIGYLTFVIKDLSGLCAALKDKGAEFTIPETEIRPGTRIAMIKDPEGNILEFVERG